MSFSSESFLIFAPVFLVLYALCPKNWRPYCLMAGSLIYCGFAGVFTLISVVLFALLHYGIGIWLADTRKESERRQICIGTVVLDVCLLLAVKILGTMPLGASFFTFAGISYIVDIYRGTQKAETNAVQLLSFFTFFPKMQLGPITRYSEFDSGKGPSWKRTQRGLTLFAMGFSVKILLADRLAVLWSELTKVGFESASTAFAWLALAGFSMQLYLEWQSYTLMARGLGSIMGISLPENFRSPYMAGSIGEFYRRWHITLMTWFKDYIYIPLGGSRAGTARTVRNILIVWLVTSLWHGLGVNYLLWGMSLGVLIVLEKLYTGAFLAKHKYLAHGYVLFFILLSWACFNIPSLSDLGLFFSRLFPFFGTFAPIRHQDFPVLLAKLWPYLLAGGVFCTPLPENLLRRYGRSVVMSLILAVIFWWAVSVLLDTGSNPMMYIKF